MFDLSPIQALRWALWKVIQYMSAVCVVIRLIWVAFDNTDLLGLLFNILRVLPWIGITIFAKWMAARIKAEIEED